MCAYVDVSVPLDTRERKRVLTLSANIFTIISILVMLISIMIMIMIPMILKHATSIPTPLTLIT